MQEVIKIGTRDSELAVWQANLVKTQLEFFGQPSELVFIKSEGDLDLRTPLYEMGVQGIFTRSLDLALLNKTIDLAVHSMKDVPTRLPVGIVEAAILKRGSYKDIFVPNEQWAINNTNKPATGGIFSQPDISDRHGEFLQSLDVPPIPIFTHKPVQPFTDINIASSSIRRKAQWLYRYPNSSIENIRGNVNTRLQKLSDSNWQGAIFAAAGLERIGKRPASAIDLDWMLPAPAQGAIMVLACGERTGIREICSRLNDDETALCTGIEREFLRELMGGCSTPVSALAQVHNKELHFEGSILSLDGKLKASVQRTVPIMEAANLGKLMAIELLNNGGDVISESIQNAK